MVSGEENYICPSSKFWEKRYYYRSSAWIIYWFKWISYMYLQPTAYSTSTSTSTTYNVPQLHRQPYQISIHNNTLTLIPMYLVIVKSYQCDKIQYQILCIMCPLSRLWTMKSRCMHFIIQSSVAHPSLLHITYHMAWWPDFEWWYP